MLVCAPVKRGAVIGLQVCLFSLKNYFIIDMEIKNLSDNELKEQINLYRNRIETLTRYISDTEDSFTRMGMDSQLKQYKSTLQALIHERKKRVKTSTVNNEEELDITLDNEIEEKKELEVVKLSKQAATQYEDQFNNQTQDASKLKSLLHQVYRSVKANPEQLNEITNYEIVGKAFLLMLDQNLSNDIDTLQMMVSVGYLCTSKAIAKDNQNYNLYKDRALVLRFGHEPLKFTVRHALNLNANKPLESFSPFYRLNSDTKARDAIYKMEIADIELNPILYKQVDLFSDRRKEFDDMISEDFFLPEKTKESVIQSGVENHTKLFNYLENRVLKEGDINF